MLATAKMSESPPLSVLCVAVHRPSIKSLRIQAARAPGLLPTMPTKVSADICRRYLSKVRAHLRS